jgi:hypothetical protein
MQFRENNFYNAQKDIFAGSGRLHRSRAAEDSTACPDELRNSLFLFSSSSHREHIGGIDARPRLYPDCTSFGNEEQSSRSSTPNMVSEPINCPPSQSESEEEQVPLEQSMEYYNSLTWSMYYRIMNSRRKKKTNRKVAPAMMKNKSHLMERNQQLSDNSPSLSHDAIRKDTTIPLAFFLHSHSTNPSYADKGMNTPTFTNGKATIIVSKRQIPVIDNVIIAAEEEIFHLDV